MRVLNIVGARPNFMKIAPLIHEMNRHPRITQRLIHTGQHYDDNLSKVFFEELDIPPPDVNLGVGSGDRLEQIERVMRAFEPVVTEERPHLVVVVGDVNSTIACARVAREQGVRVAHIEAGLRSFDASMPEEHNRIETDRIADYLLVTERSGMENLAAEQVPGKSYLVGNVMIDSLVASLARAERSTVLGTLSLEPGGYAVGTFHRPSNVDSRSSLEALVEVITLICSKLPLVLPLHPRTRKSLEHHGLFAEVAGLASLTLCEPMGYLDFLALLKTARAVVTDSGGIQEETTFLRVPCLTMRGNTERPVTTEVGSNLLVGNSPAKLAGALERVLAGPRQVGEVPELWDGHAATRIVGVLLDEIED